MAAQESLDAALILGFELVVELLADPLPHLGTERTGVQARGQALDQRHQQHRVAQVGLDRFGDTRVLHLDHHVVTFERAGAMNLSDRCRRKGVLVKVAEDA